MALPRLFEPFTQIHPHTTDRGQGAGLGLAISRALVAGMGGEIGAERREERGSRFWFELHLPPAAVPARCEAPPPELDEHSARTLLLVEDDEVNRVVGKALLERRGHRVLVATTGMAAVRMVRDHPVDVVLMDIRLPDIDGFEAAKRIRSLYRGTLQPRHPPIIALTAQVEPSDATACEAAGIDDLVVKPFSPAASNCCSGARHRSLPTVPQPAATRRTGSIPAYSPITSRPSARGVPHAS